VNFSESDSLQPFRDFLASLVGPKTRFGTIRALGEAIGITQSVVGRAMRPGGYSFDAETCLRLALAVPADPSLVLRLAGKAVMLDLIRGTFGVERPSSDLTAQDFTWLALSPDEKDALLRVATAFRATRVVPYVAEVTNMTKVSTRDVNSDIQRLSGSTERAATSSPHGQDSTGPVLEALVDDIAELGRTTSRRAKNPTAHAARGGATTRGTRKRAR